MSDEYTDDVSFEMSTVIEDYGDEAEWFIDIVSMYEDARKKANTGTPLGNVVLDLCG
jgi:hypothetical protein